MHGDEKVQAQTRAIRRNAYQGFRENSGSEETTNQCTLFVVGAVVFFTGFWAVTCLISAVMKDGPVVMLKNLTTAVIGF